MKSRNWIALMKPLRLVGFAILLALLAGEAMAATCTSNASGDWKDNVWTGTGCNTASGPPAGSIVTIANSTNIQVDSNTLAATNVTINAGGTLRGNNGNTLTLTGNFTSNGTFTANGGTVAFTGTAQTITGNVAFANLTAGTSTVLTLAGNVTVTGTVTGTINLADTCPTNYTLTLANGTVMNSCAGGGGGGGGGVAACIPTTVAGVPSPLIAGIGKLCLKDNNNNCNGGNGTVNGNPIVVSGNTSLPVTGTTSALSAGALPALTPATFPAVGTATLNTTGTVAAGSYGTINASGNPTVFSGGTYYIDTLNATGPIQLAAGTYYINSLNLSANLSVTGAVQLFIGNKVGLGANGVSLNAGGNAGNLQVNLYGGAEFEAGKSNISFTGLIYSPFASSQVQFDNNATITGAIITAGQIQFGNNVTINYNATVQGQISSLACPVSGPDHYELSLPTSSITCLPTTVTVTACANSSNPCTSVATGVTGTVSLATTGGTIGAAALTAGMGTTNLSYPLAADGTTVTVSLTSATTTAVNAATCLSGNCSTTFNKASFVFSASANSVSATIPTQVAGMPSGTYYLRAVKTNTTTKSCQAALTGTQSVNFAYECNNPVTCYAANLMNVNGGAVTTVARNNNGSVSSYLPVNMTFDANGNAPFSFNYSDVGQVKFYASKAAGGSLLSALTGSSNAFVVAPHHFGFSGITAAPIKAGNSFSATVTAYNGLVTPTVTPSFGKETSPEGVTLSFAKYQPTGAGAANGIFSGSVGAFSNGAASITNLNWSEVGTIDLIATLTSGSYLGSGFTATGTTGTIGAVGRFIPDHFDTAIINGCLSCGFTYSGQPFIVYVTAKNGLAIPTTTVNYDGTVNTSPNFAKAVTLSAWDAATGTTQNSGPGTLSKTAVALTSFVSGMASLNTAATMPFYTFTTVPTIPTIIRVRAVDTDNVASLRVPLSSSTEGQPEIRSGRIKIVNAHGSELLQLPITVTAQYWNASSSYVTSIMDSSSSFVVATPPVFSAVNFGNYQKHLTVVSVAGSPKIVSFLSGIGSFKLSAPGAGNDGSVDMFIPAPTAASCNAVPTPLGCYLPSNTARASFGVYKGANEFIYLRENY